jgi:hypothetical protein
VLSSGFMPERAHIAAAFAAVASVAAQLLANLIDAHRQAAGLAGRKRS